MPTSLSKKHRDVLEKVTAEARLLAENACKAALDNLAVHEKESRSHMSAEQRALRKRLRSRGKALGDARNERTGTQELNHLIDLAAYEHWHRLLFTRFLTENHLLITDEANGNVAVTLEECEELARELGARDGFDLACRFASRTLPGVFRKDDPVLDLALAVNDQVAMRKLLATMPADCFRADDALGWTYQYWQAQRKKEVNDSGKKIGADELSPVTQLFTEDYMVEFLLHNTLGAWWAGKLGPITAESEVDARAAASLGARDDVPGISWTYLRLIQDGTTKQWRPAAGTFGGWPRSAAEIQVVDPCMGSGHFLVFALPLLVRLRMEEQRLDGQAAVLAVLQDNLFGLELDERCTQIAAFNVALTAWRLVGYHALPPPNLACSGLVPSNTEAEWTALAGDDPRTKDGIAQLHRLFAHAPVLGSLINPRLVSGRLIDADFDDLAPLLGAAQSASSGDRIELAYVAQGMAKAADLLAQSFTLVVTNVPYLGDRKQCDELKAYCGEFHAHGKANIATCFVERCRTFSSTGGSVALVTPQNWLLQDSYKELRSTLLRQQQWDFVAKLGPGAFEEISGEVVDVVLSSLTNAEPHLEQRLCTIDVTSIKQPKDKARALIRENTAFVLQASQLHNPDARMTLDVGGNVPLLENRALAPQGVITGDMDRWTRKFWEVQALGKNWPPFLSTPQGSGDFAGREHVVDWSTGGLGMIRPRPGNVALGKRGVAISQMGKMSAVFYLGELYDGNIAPLVPIDAADTGALWAYCSSPQYEQEVRRIDKKVNLTNGSLLKAPFDVTHWRQAVTNDYPSGLPKPHSNDPTQWLFNGHPKGAEQPLHVAVARLLGYRWPRQSGSTFPDCPALGDDGLEKFADDDGIVCLPALNRERPAATRLRQLLTAALGVFDERVLVAAAGLKGSKSTNLEEWLRDEFFEQHTKLFHDRPFVWHLWDGRPDGFHALVHYHRLDHATLQKLAYSYLGNWIQQQDSDAKADKPGAAPRLGAAQKLQSRLAAILEGEAPLDIFVRWKPIAEQAQGWHPDLNDGIRQNIRPFLLAGDVGKKGAGLFRSVPLSLKDKDRGTEPQRSQKDYPWFWCEDEPGTDPVGGDEFVGNRWNNVHLTLARKMGKESTR